MGIGRFAFTPLLPMMQDDQGVTVAAGGWLASANYLGYLAGALGAVWLRVAPQTVIRWGLALIAVASMAPTIRKAARPEKSWHAPQAASTT